MTRALTQKQFLGSAVLNGPVGAKDTPEQFLPIAAEGTTPTTMALVIEAETPAEARDKQILWHLVRNRIAALKSETPCHCYGETATASIATLEALSDRLAN